MCIYTDEPLNSLVLLKGIAISRQAIWSVIGARLSLCTLRG